MDPQEFAKAFVERINAQDVDGLCALMTEDHLFIDGGGEYQKGREAMKQGWRDYFRMVLDYWIKVEKMFKKDNSVALFDKAGGTYAPTGMLDPKNKWEIPAAWLVVVQVGKVLTWQVYADNEQLRQIMVRIAEEEKS